jgi:hypothetical protein
MAWEMTLRDSQALFVGPFHRYLGKGRQFPWRVICLAGEGNGTQIQNAVIEMTLIGACRPLKSRQSSSCRISSLFPE